MPRTIVITGGSGFVGRYLLEELKQHWSDAALVSWDRTSSAPVGVKAEKIDITDVNSYEQSLAAIQPDWIVHLAAVSSVGQSVANPVLASQVNVLGTVNLIKTAADVSPHTKILVVSSADIYGSVATDNEPLRELPLLDCRPNNPYAKSKWEMEKAIEENFNDRCLRVRPFPHIGPGQSLGFVTADFASQIAAIEAGKQLPLIKVGNLAAKRDFTDVRDVVRAYRLLLEKEVVGDVYNIASGQATKIEDLLNSLLAMSSQKIEVETDPGRLRPSDTPIVIGDGSKLKELTEWQPTIPLSQSLSDILTDWRSRTNT